jgi:hypothetical protein
MLHQNNHSFFNKENQSPKIKTMKEFIMFFRHEQPDAEPSQEQMQEVLKQWQRWIKGIAQKGNYSSTNRLLFEGKTLKQNNVITDGPHMEAKEMIGGYLIVKTNSLDEAVELAKTCPSLIGGNGIVEVRALMPIDSNLDSDNFLNKK